MTTIYALTDAAKDIKGIVVSLEGADLRFKIARAIDTSKFTIEEDSISGDMEIKTAVGTYNLITINKFF